MHVVSSICEHEIPMAHRWLDWVCELGGTEGHSFHLIPSSGVDISALIPKANKAFGSVSIIKDEEKEKSDWQVVEPMRSASGPNSSFRQVAWHFYHGKLGPYFWCELDCIPLRKDWLDTLQSEYNSCGKPFLGAYVEIENVPPHMSGNGIYVNVPEQAPTLIQRTEWMPKGQGLRYELAFDIAGSKEVIPKAHFTALIQHKFRFKGFESRYEFDAVIDKNAVVFHSDKRGSIYPYLRENLTGIFPVTKDESSGAIAGVAPKSGAQNICDGAGEVSAGGHDAEPASPQTCITRPIESEPHPPTVESKTFTPSEDLQNVIEQNAVIKNGLPAMSPPWENREDSERDVKMLCDALALFTKSPVYKHRVRQALREARIIK